MTNDRWDGYPGDAAGLGDEDDVPELSERFVAAVKLAQTPEQQEVARQIYRRLEDGAEVDDVKPLIEEMMRVVVTQRNDGRVSGPEAGEEGGSAGVVGGVGHRQGAWGAARDNGLARQEDDRRAR